MIRTISFVNLCMCVTSLKLLFLKSYVSTDFDVHRNWMAITYNLPILDWYFDSTSQWTLDYPPLFAVFEFFLALIAHLLDLTNALQLSEHPIRSESIVIYQKVTVILSDCVYYYAIYKLCKSLKPILVKSLPQHQSHHQPQQQPQQSHAITTSKKHQDQNLTDAIYRPDSTSCIALLLILQPGLLLVDHIHFQYNGFLSGVLLLSLANIISGRYISGSLWFAVLLNLKHIYLYCAPAYGMYLLTSYCLVSEDKRNRIVSFILRAGRLGSVVVLVFVITYLPFGDIETLRQILKRLFPFKRGLTHAYWAPNIWSIYNLVDKILATVYRDSIKVSFDMESISQTKQASSTSGLVQEYKHEYLPTIKPATTFMLVGFFIIPIVIKFLLTINRQSPRLFMKGVILTTFTSFMFGWHVHEKAIILVVLPLIPICFTDTQLRNTFLRLTLTGTYSLFPLIFTPAEYLTKLTILLTYYFYAESQTEAKTHQVSATKLGHETTSKRNGLISRTWSRLYSLMDNILVVAIILNEIYVTWIHGRFNYSWNPLAPLNKYQFLPLMVTSNLSAFGILISFLELQYDFLVSPHELLRETKMYTSN